MDFVMINQLPELAIARNRIIPHSNEMTVPTKEKRNPYISKWHALFDNGNEQWISFQPRIGRTAYPCFSCRDMFANRNSFLDHINRRGMILKYLCCNCDKQMTFYNTCSFLVHARSHFTHTGGSVNLENVDISTISMDVAGFMPHPDYPRMFDLDDTTTRYDLNINVKFYRPKEEFLGCRVVFFEPNELIFYCTIRNDEGVEETHSMMLCQVCRKIPKCEFIPIDAIATKQMNSSQTTKQEKEIPAPSLNNNSNIIKDNNTTNSNQNTSVDKPAINNLMEVDSDEDDVISVHTVPDEIICLDDESSDEDVCEIPEVDALLEPKIDSIQVKNLKDLLQNSLSSSSSEDENSTKQVTIKKTKLEKQVPHCQECGEKQIGPMKDHFQQNDKPIDDDIKCTKCSLILPSPCSLRAHFRIHDKLGPFVCPECGKDFEYWHKLFSHMEDVCFHLAKHIRYKCPAKKCGKIFAQTVTFSTHFPVQHISIRFTCDICAETFSSEEDFAEHSKLHTITEPLSVTSYECLICSCLFDAVEDHVKIHCHDNDNRIYVYTCKYCKSYYRSKNTYAAHLLRCTKLLLNTQVKKEAVVERSDVKCKVVRYCKNCNSKIQFHCSYKDVKSIGKTCPRCNTFFGTVSDVKPTSKDIEKLIQKDNNTSTNICILCTKPMDLNSIHDCKYQHSIVLLHKAIPSPSLSNSPESSNSEDGVKRRKKRLHSPFKNIKPNNFLEDSYNIHPVKPIIFDGEYFCKVCDYRSKSRVQFHEHIQTHRDISTAYQCMECGECFVVKPSLIKHLQVFHLIDNVESYINDNECFDKEAVRELKENMRMIPGETKEPVAENQCRVCRQMFSDELELSKHFRVHGMAFLMKKIIPNK